MHHSLIACLFTNLRERRTRHIFLFDRAVTALEVFMARKVARTAAVA